MFFLTAQGLFIMEQYLSVKKKILKKWTNSETGEMMQRISEKSGSNDSAYTSKTLNQYIYNDDEDFLRANSGFQIRPLNPDIYGA